MTNIKINRKNNTIEITKAFNKMASIYGSDEYIMLREAKLDNPGFRVIVKSTKQKKETNKGLTYEYMEKYISKHDEDGTIMAEYEMLRGLTPEAEEALTDSFSYNDMKEWFFIQFPEIAEFHQKREKVLDEIKKAREERKAKEAEENKKSKLQKVA